MVGFIFEFVKAAYTGHRGLATTHSENAEEAFGRLLTLSKGAKIGESEMTVKQMLAKSIDYIFYLKDFKVAGILKTESYNAETDRFVFKEVV